MILVQVGEKKTSPVDNDGKVSWCGRKKSRAEKLFPRMLQQAIGMFIVLVLYTRD